MAERTPGLEKVELDAPREEGGEAGCPRHVAIIMDGNHRWAKRRRLPGAAGHRTGARNVRPVAEACADRGVTCLTLFAFSTENWQRPRQEVNLLMDLMRNVMENDLDELHRREVRLQIIGDRSRFPSDLQMEMNRAEAMTRDNSRMSLNVAVNFGGRWDIAQAARALARQVREGECSLEEIDEERFAAHLSLGGLPDPDICIRTGGDHRISNFLLWDFAYTELYFTDTYWPDFDAACLHEALNWFDDRQRRFGRRT
jgi:undecaprenyl diphosphate synthase